MKRFVPFVIIVLLLLQAISVMAQEPVTITWFIGIGTGDEDSQIVAQQQVVDAFNASQSEIVLEMLVADNLMAVDTLTALIASGDAPDIVGPAGFSGANAFNGQWLALDDLIAADGYDLSQFPQSAVDVYRDTQGNLLGLPLANYPATIFWRPALFEAAGLEPLPSAYGEPYILDGVAVEWNIDTLTEVAKRLTLDFAGTSAVEPGFFAGDTVQWGFFNQSSQPMRQQATLFGSGSLYQIAPDGSYVATMPDNWVTAFNWLYTSIWDDQFYPTSMEQGADLLGMGDPFASGNVAMAQAHLWYATCCLAGDSGWNIAPMPSYNGIITARLHADTFRILASTEHPQEAFEVLKYLTGDASLDLLAIYGGMPAREADQAQFFATLDQQFPQGVNWEIAGESLAYTDVPSHEEWLPNNNVANERIDAFSALLQSTPGLNVDAEIAALLEDLTVIYNE